MINVSVTTKKNPQTITFSERKSKPKSEFLLSWLRPQMDEIKHCIGEKNDTT